MMQRGTSPTSQMQAGGQHAIRQSGTSIISWVQDAMEVPVYGSSSQAAAANDLFDAYRSGDVDAIRSIVREPRFEDLDNQASL